MNPNLTYLRSENLHAAKEPLSPFGRAMALGGVILYCGPLWGLVITTIHSILKYQNFSNLAHPGDSEKTMTFAIHATTPGIAIGLLGATMIVISMLYTNYRSKWLFSWTIAISIFWCVILFPLGLVIGIPMAVMSSRKRHAWREQSRTSLRR